MNNALKENLQILENLGPYELSPEKAEREQRVLQRNLKSEERTLIRKIWEIRLKKFAAENNYPVDLEAFER